MDPRSECLSIKKWYRYVQARPLYIAHSYARWCWCSVFLCWGYYNQPWWFICRMHARRQAASQRAPGSQCSKQRMDSSLCIGLENVIGRHTCVCDYISYRSVWCCINSLFFCGT